MNTHWIIPRRPASPTLAPSRAHSHGASLDRLFEDVRRGFDRRPLAASRVSGFAPTVDVRETDEEVRITAELPGLSEEDFEVNVDANVLSLKGVKKSEREKDAKGYARVERSSGSFERRFRLGWEIDAETVSAKFTSGVLEIVLPKPAEEQPQVRTIAVTSE